MVKDILKDSVLERLGHLRTSRKDWLTRNCMMCHTQGESPDRRGRFGIRINPDGSIAVRCFNCKYGAKFVPGEPFSRKFKMFLTEIGMSQYDIKKLNFELYKEKSNMDADPNIVLRKSITTKWVPKPLPNGTMSIKDWLEAGCTDKNLIKVAEYAYSRCFRDFDSIYWSPTNDAMYSRRILLPFYYHGEVVGYTGRFYGEPATKDIPKYHNTMPDDYIYNLDDQYAWDRQYVILCEGVFDAYFVDGISASGNTLNEDQIAIINGLGKKIIVCPDNDNAGGKLVDIALANNWGVSFPQWERGIKDPSSAVEHYGRIMTVASIVNSAEFNPITIQLKWRLAERGRNKGLHT